MNAKKNKSWASILTEQNSIEEVHNYYRTIISYMPNNVYWLDRNCVTQGCNNNVLKLVGLKSLQEFVGITYERMGKIAGWTEGQADSFKKDDQEVLSTGIAKINVEEPPVYDNDGNPHYYISSRMPIYDQESQDIVGVVGISVDITERKKMEEDLRKAKIAAEASSRAKSEFIANMSHDTKIPLSGIIGIAKMLERDASSAKEKQHARDILNCGNRLLELFISILDNVSADYANLNDLHLETFDLREEIKSLAELELLAIQLKNLKLDIDIDDKVPKFIVCDRVKLHQILLNLLGNAIKFTDKGHITIAVKLMKKMRSKVELKFSVIDTGIGIPEEAREKVFEKFFTVDPIYKGLRKGHGIGLNTVQLYTKLLGGEVQLDSQLGVGTTFYFVLPVAIGKESDAKSIGDASQREIDIQAEHEKTSEQISPVMPAETASEYIGSNISAGKALILEDDKFCADIAIDMTKQLNYSVIYANSGETALQLAKKQQFDLILADIGLPGMSGDEFAVALRQWEKVYKKSRVLIVALTGHVQNSAMRALLMSAGIDIVLDKPVDLSILKSAINIFRANKARSSREMKIYTEEGRMNYETFIAQKKSVGILGEDLPNTYEELYQLDAYKLFDFEAVLKRKETLDAVYTLVKNYISLTIDPGIEELKKFYPTNDWEDMMKLAHRLKGSASYIDVKKMYYACMYLERFYRAGHREQEHLEKLYQQLLNVMNETREYLMQWLLQQDIVNK